MYQLRKSEERGRGEFGWLSAKYSFSFSNYYDEKHIGFRDLLVINEDLIDANRGFAEHSHREMEIITYMIDGSIHHKDSIGNEATIHTGEVQRMSAGTGIRHSEKNPETQKRTHLLQIWIQPQKKGTPPSYEQLSYRDQQGNNQLALLVSPNGSDGSLGINQDILLYRGKLKNEEKMQFSVQKNRHVWIQMVSGGLKVNDVLMQAGDGLAISEVDQVNLQANKSSEFLLFDLN